ncbi:hypothetical protein VKT23_017686 [Stygiomarasmius scandens]|uniref:Uncharacterized protein n=1 Tax=Marasmiellus scandens TaxID=2682957 RepID=A0ABR1IVS7_9AGAR
MKRKQTESSTELNGTFQLSRDDLFTPSTQTNVEIGSMSADTQRLTQNDVSLQITSPQKKRQREIVQLIREACSPELVQSSDGQFEWEGHYYLDDGAGWKDIGNEDRDEPENKVIVVKRRYLSSVSKRIENCVIC